MEFARSSTVTDLPTALEAVRQVGRPEFTMLIDTMHVARSGHSAAKLAGLEPGVVGYVHLADSSLRQRNTRYRDDSIDRSVPGEGELPLTDLLLALPPVLPISVEAPMRSRAEAGSSPAECARLAIEGARGVLATRAVRSTAALPLNSAAARR
ncbi:hypothetical protein [Cryptosporangium sp. NPDC048952]|uniref:hypothetical protein n=1 Tax=Cryptosporangium sp. NPDC048952 TaxID=3363961 RepID=UPI003720BD41